MDEKEIKGMQEEDYQRREALRKILIELRDEIREKIAEEMGIKVAEDPRMSTISTMDSGDLAQLYLDTDIDYSILNMDIERLRNLEHVLDRLQEGSYGYCEDCGRPIKLKRLQVLPFTRYCVQCQEHRETMDYRGRVRKMRREEEPEDQRFFL